MRGEGSEKNGRLVLAYETCDRCITEERDRARGKETNPLQVERVWLGSKMCCVHGGEGGQAGVVAGGRGIACC